MTEADEVKHAIGELTYNLTGIVADGSAATEAGNIGVRHLLNAKIEFDSAKVHALQALGNLQEAIGQANNLFFKTTSAEASNIIAQLNTARELVNEYVNLLSNRIQTLNVAIGVLKMGTSTKMSESGSHIRVAMEELAKLYGRY